MCSWGLSGAVQSFNVHMSDANFGKLTSLHFYAWRKGLKTGMYYLRTRAASDAIKFTVDQQAPPPPSSDISCTNFCMAAERLVGLSDGDCVSGLPDDNVDARQKYEHPQDI